jgi:hypothetical protein
VYCVGLFPLTVHYNAQYGTYNSLHTFNAFVETLYIQTNFAAIVFNHPVGNFSHSLYVDGYGIPIRYTSRFYQPLSRKLICTCFPFTSISRYFFLKIFEPTVEESNFRNPGRVGLFPLAISFFSVIRNVTELSSYCQFNTHTYV